MYDTCVFEIEAHDGRGNYANLVLPVTDHELYDILEKMNLPPDNPPQISGFLQNKYWQCQTYLTDCNFYELNELAKRLHDFSWDQNAAFEGLFKMALDKREGPMCFTDLLTYANSVDCCNVTLEASDDRELGWFYANNGFLPELDELPDSVFKKLDFKKIGEEMRNAEHGVFTQHGYVVQHSALTPLEKDYSLPPARPSYTVRVEICHRSQTNGQPATKSKCLDLPVNKISLEAALTEIDAQSVDNVFFGVEDCIVPDLLETMDCSERLQSVIDMANAIFEVHNSGQLTKFKAILATIPCLDLDKAMDIANHLEDYFFEPDKHSPEDVAEEELRFMMPEDDAALLIKYVDLCSYGKELIKQSNSKLTEYGLIARRDGQPIQSQENTGTQMNMEMG